MQKKLDPYRVGEIVGVLGFSPGDYVILTKERNMPAKVRSRNPGTVRIILGDETDSVYGEADYYASDLGYPMLQALWSENQKYWYARCHTDPSYRRCWQNSEIFAESTSNQKKSGVSGKVECVLYFIGGVVLLLIFPSFIDEVFNHTYQGLQLHIASSAFLGSVMQSVLNFTIEVIKYSMTLFYLLLGIWCFYRSYRNSVSFKK